MGAEIAAHGSISKKRAGIVNRLFDAIGGGLIVLCNVRPNIKNIRSGERRKSVNAHCLDKRQ